MNVNMRKFLLSIIAGIFMIIVSSTIVFADATIDTSNSANGLVSVRYNGTTTNTLKAQVEKGGATYNYTIKPNVSANLPLQMGTGSYKISVFEGVGGNKYKTVDSKSITVSSINENNMFQASIPIINFDSTMTSIKGYNEMLSDKSDKVDLLYNDVITYYSYDFEKAKAVVGTEYVPVIDEMYAKKKGICYDYAALVAGVLRSQGVPTKLVMGYSPDIKEYHAWNQVYMNNQWYTVDTTYDAQAKANNITFTFAKDTSKFTVLKTY